MGTESHRYTKLKSLSKFPRGSCCKINLSPVKIQANRALEKKKLILLPDYMREETFFFKSGDEPSNTNANTNTNNNNNNNTFVQCVQNVNKQQIIFENYND